MNGDKELIRKRFSELARRAEKSGRAVYSPFLALNEQDILSRMGAELIGIGHSVFGGADGCERVIAAFYEGEAPAHADYPIKCLIAEPVNRKFAEKLTHRDILGAVMALGIERSAVGDIVVREDGAYLFVLKKLADYIKDNLTEAKHTRLKTAEADSLPEGAFYKLSPAELTVASERLDCIVAAFCKLSRGDASELISKGLVSINGEQPETGSKPVSEDSIVSVRGYGRFILREQARRTRKDRLVVRIKKYE